MYELAARLAIVGGAFAVSLSGPGGVFGLEIAGALAALEVFSYLLNRRGLRDANAATVLAALEIGGIALWLADAGELSRFGVIVAAPLLWAVGRQGARASALAPIAAASLISADVLIGRLPVLSAALLAPSGLVLILGLLSEPTAPVYVRVEPVTPERPLTLTGDDYIELREGYRALKQRYRDLEKRAERDALMARLFELRQKNAGNVYPALAEMIADFSGAEGAAIFGLLDSSSTMIVRGATTDFPGELSERSYAIDRSLSERDLRLKLDMSLRAIPSAERRDFTNLLLIREGEMVGMICMGQGDVESLKACRDKTASLAPLLADLLWEERDRERSHRELASARALYALASLAGASATPDAKAQTMLGTLVGLSDKAEGATLAHLDGAIVSTLDGTLVGQSGAKLDFVDALIFEKGEGLAGWRSSGFPEISILDARNDARCSSEAAVRRRIGSFFIAPLTKEGTVIGYFAAASHRCGGIDPACAEFLARAAKEIANVFPAPKPSSTIHEAVLSGPEFVQQIKGREGSLVVLELLHQEKLAESHGPERLMSAIEALQRRLAHQMPSGSALCRKGGGFLAFLLERSHAQAAEWANAATADAAFIAVTQADGSDPKPLAIRARVAEIGSRTLSESAGLAA